MSFKDFNFKDYIQEALDEIKFKEPTPVQQKLIPVVRSGRDLVGESKTGSGKTHTFLLPIFEKLNPESRDVQVVITAPSRELATQIYQSTKQIAKHSDTEIRVVNYVGGTDKQRQIEKLKVAQPHIVIGTWDSWLLWIRLRQVFLRKFKFWSSQQPFLKNYNHS